MFYQNDPSSLAQSPICIGLIYASDYFFDWFAFDFHLFLTSMCMFRSTPDYLLTWLPTGALNRITTFNLLRARSFPGRHHRSFPWPFSVALGVVVESLRAAHMLTHRHESIHTNITSQTDRHGWRQEKRQRRTLIVSPNTRHIHTCIHTHTHT